MLIASSLFVCILLLTSPILVLSDEAATPVFIVIEGLRDMDKWSLIGIQGLITEEHHYQTLLYTVRDKVGPDGPVKEYGAIGKYWFERLVKFYKANLDKTEVIFANIIDQTRHKLSLLKIKNNPAEKIATLLHDAFFNHMFPYMLRYCIGYIAHLRQNYITSLAEILKLVDAIRAGGDAVKLGAQIEVINEKSKQFFWDEADYHRLGLKLMERRTLRYVLDKVRILIGEKIKEPVLDYTPY